MPRGKFRATRQDRIVPLLCPSCGADAGEIPRHCPSCGVVLDRGPDEYIGRTVAQKYQIEALIGEGGMGKVYRARQVALDKVVVLKVLRQSLLSDQRTVARFRREAKAASRLNHPNSISVLDFGQVEDGALFIAMEFVSGKDLHSVLSSEWPLSEPRVIRIVSQVLSALSDAHRAGVIHRDLKPENIMVEQRRNEPDFVKVLDFGIAKIQDASGDEGAVLTRAGFVCGTPEYMSPEQARGAALDHRSDLYAVGVILYQLMTGLLPFEADSAVGFATKHLNEEPLPPSRRRPDARISPSMERLILRTLSKNPDDRPPDAEAFIAELLAVEKEAPRRPVAARRSQAGQAVLAPLPRGASPAKAAATEILEEGWGTLRHEHDRPKADTESLEMVPTALVATLKAGSPTSSELNTGGGFGFFKGLTVLLVLTALGIAGYFLYSLSNPETGEPFVPPPNAPVPKPSSTLSPGLQPVLPLYEQEIAPEARDARRADEFRRQGDQAYQSDDLGMAASQYKSAFQFNPVPELSLKLGEVYWQNGHSDEARGWWERHLRDKPNSKARTYIETCFPDMVRR